MPLTAKVSQKPDQGQRSAARRADRLEARRVLWTESTIKRVRQCGKSWVPGNETGVAIRGTYDRATSRYTNTGFGGLESCGSVWSCPWCSAKIATERAADVEKVVRVLQGMGRGVVHLTLTMRHRSGQSLPQLWDALSSAWHAVTSGDAWIADQKRWGFAMSREVKSGKRKGQVVVSTRIPFVRVVEVTHGANGWHVHVHALLFLGSEVMDATADELGRRLFSRWRAQLLGDGFDATERHGVTCRPIGQDEAFGDYFTKAQYDGPTVAALEVARADLHDARHGNRTPWAILRSVHETGDADDLVLWHEWERGSKGRRQFAWSPGLRHLAWLHDERSDEEIAAEEHGGEVLAYVASRRDWLRVCTARGVLVGILAAAELGQAALEVELQRLGVCYVLPWLDEPPG